MDPPGSTFRYKDIVLYPQLPPPRTVHLPPITSQDEAQCRQGSPGPTLASSPVTWTCNRVPASHTPFSRYRRWVLRPVGGNLRGPLSSSWASAHAPVALSEAPFCQFNFLKDTGTN